MDSKTFNQKGATLIELIVVLAILVFVMGSAVSIFLSLLLNQNKAMREQELFSQVSYGVGYMASLAQEAQKDSGGSCLGAGYSGYNYRATHFDSPSGFYRGLKFVSKDGNCEEFFLDTDGFMKEKKDSQAAQHILSDKFEVIYARFIINGNKSTQGASGTNLVQPRITFVLDVKTRDAQNPEEKIIQTTVSQRNLNQ